MRSAAASLLFLLIAHIGFADDKAVAVGYVKARCSTLVRGATDADVDRVMALFAVDAVVEHPAFHQIVRGKDNIRRGIASHLPEYTGDKHDSGIVVLSTIEAPGAVAFRTNITFVVGEGADRKVISRDGLLIVEVRGSKISRVIEY